MNILLVEDDEKLCNSFEKVVEKRKNVIISQKTNSSTQALKLIKNYKYDGIIVDLELHYGEGSGFDLLREIKKLNLNPKPIIIVNTNILSEVVYDNIHKGLADMIFYKKQINYSPKRVIDTMLQLKQTNDKANDYLIEVLEDKQKRIKELINSELDLVGINYRLKGRKYIFDAIIYKLQNKDADKTAIQYLSNKYKLLTSSISRAIQTAINEAWRTTAIEDLEANYKAKINYNTGIPTPTEFIYYYVEKIGNMIENH